VFYIILFGARNLYKKKSAQESMTHAQKTYVNFWYKCVVQDSWANATPISLTHETKQKF